MFVSNDFICLGTPTAIATARAFTYLVVLVVHTMKQLSSKNFSSTASKNIVLFQPAGKKKGKQ